MARLSPYLEQNYIEFYLKNSKTGGNLQTVMSLDCNFTDQTASRTIIFTRKHHPAHDEQE
jgi:hypothetical protein